MKSIEERFRAKIEITETGCHQWIGATAGDGYGLFHVEVTPTGVPRREYAHRWAYERYVGPIPDGLVIDHLCRNHGCVNPSHLEAVTQQVNLARGVGNSSRTHCPSGHPYSGDNLRTHRGKRYCRTCAAARDAGRPRSTSRKVA